MILPEAAIGVLLNPRRGWHLTIASPGKIWTKRFFFFSGLGFSISYLSRCQVSFISFLYQAGDDFDKDETLKTRKDFATAGV
jgi:hypothetical protein